MKRSWTTILLIVGLIGLLVLLGGLQYRWLSQISVSEGEKAHKRVQDQAERFAMDFNREIQNSYFNFQTNAETWQKKDWSSFNERYDYWRDKTAYPGLVTDFYFFETRIAAPPLRYDRESRSFVPIEMNTELIDLRSRFSDAVTFRPVYADIYTLVLPIHGAEGHKVEHIMIRSRNPGVPEAMRIPPKFGYLAIRLDPAVVKDQILPDLTAKYFGEGEFRAAVTDNADQPVFHAVAGGASDATAPLLDLSPENVLFANKDLMKSIGGERHSGVVMTSQMESHSFNRTEARSNSNNDNNGETLKIEIKRETVPRTSVFTTTTATGGGANPPWTVQVQHVYGSIDAFTASTLRRNLAIGFGLLFLLAAAVAAIIISAQRAKTVAQRQIDFVSSVSHEFRTPLAVIYSAGENLADGVATEFAQVSLYGNLIKGEGKKLTGMVEQILDFAGANSGRKKYYFAENSVAAMVEDALTECQPLLIEKEINVETGVAASLPVVRADKAAISQALQNLIVNSVKYGNGEKWLRVSAENGGSTVKISVEDHGIGISKADLKQIFEPFYRSKEVVDAQIHGNGLGLALVKQIAESHGGKVRAESEKGKGSRFTIELPSFQ